MTPQEYEETKLGTPQGNLSPLLSNIMLNELEPIIVSAGPHGISLPVFPRLPA